MLGEQFTEEGAALLTLSEMLSLDHVASAAPVWEHHRGAFVKMRWR